MKFHKIEEKDLEKLYNLYLQLVEFGDLENMRRVFAEIKESPHYILFGVYTEEDELVATASLTKCFDLTEDSRYYYSMENFVVDKNFRRQGAGKFLLKNVEEYVKANGGRYINFTSSAWRKDAHAFYENSGYKADYVKGFKKEF